MTARFGKATGKRRKNIIRVLAAAASAITLFTAISAWQDWFWFAPRQAALSVPLPGASDEHTSAWSLRMDETDQIEARLLTLLGRDGQLLAWYRLPGRTGRPPGESAPYALAADQLRYGQYLLEQDRRKAFQEWWLYFRRQWLNDSGDVRERLFSLPADTDDGSSPAGWLRENLLLARILAQSCSLWPDQARLEDLHKLSALLLPVLADSGFTEQTAYVPVTAPVLDPGATPTPKPPVTPTPDPDREQALDVLRLASLDLFAMQALVLIDPAWQSILDTSRERVIAGYLNDALPLYAWAWQPSGGYLPFAGSQPLIDTEEAMATILHLCEVGIIPQTSISWIRDQLYNHTVLYAAYHAGQGSAAVKQESHAVYAMVARIARIIQDEALYRAAVDRLLWHQATSRTSPALSAFFRETANDEIFVWAADNTWALLALR